MSSPLPNPLAPRIAALVLGALLAASVVYWVLQWPHPDAGPALPPTALQDGAPALDAAQWARLLGAGAGAAGSAPLVAGQSRYQLMGVIASGAGKGVALLSVSGRPPQHYPVGSVVDEGLVLQSVEQRSAALATDMQGPVRLRLQLPPQ